MALSMENAKHRADLHASKPQDNVDSEENKDSAQEEETVDIALKNSITFFRQIECLLRLVMEWV